MKGEFRSEFKFCIGRTIADCYSWTESVPLWIVADSENGLKDQWRGGGDAR